jgi:hypothetical protein
MVTARRAPSRGLALAAILLVAVASLWIGAPTPERFGATGPSEATEQDERGRVTARDAVDALVAPALAATRQGDLRVLGLWILPGIAAALAARRVLRSQQLRPALLLRTVLAGSVANRAPPRISD